MQFQKLKLKNVEGKALSARLDLPIDEKPTTYAIFAHCFTCSKNLNAVGHINRALAMNGIAVLRFDFTGLGESEGDFADTNFSSNVADLVAAADFLTANFEAPQLLIGHSLGGAAVLQAAQSIPSSVAMATIGAPASPSDLGHLLGRMTEDIESRGEANTGPTPYDYLVAALGACTSMTIRLYADRKQWPVEGVTVRLKHQKIHAEDCEQCETKSNGKIDSIEREIELLGPLGEAQRARLMEIADRCPVHRTLRSDIAIGSRLKD